MFVAWLPYVRHNHTEVADNNTILIQTRTVYQQLFPKSNRSLLRVGIPAQEPTVCV
jgi:hypothetical protein